MGITLSIRCLLPQWRHLLLPSFACVSLCESSFILFFFVFPFLFLLSMPPFCIPSDVVRTHWDRYQSENEENCLSGRPVSGNRNLILHCERLLCACVWVCCATLSLCVRLVCQMILSFCRSSSLFLSFSHLPTRSLLSFT